MKKGKYIDIYVIMACLSHKKSTKSLQVVDHLIEQALEPSEKTNSEEQIFYQEICKNQALSEIQK